MWSCRHAYFIISTLRLRRCILELHRCCFSAELTVTFSGDLSIEDYTVFKILDIKSGLFLTSRSGHVIWINSDSYMVVFCALLLIYLFIRWPSLQAPSLVTLKICLAGNEAGDKTNGCYYCHKYGKVRHPFYGGFVRAVIHRTFPKKSSIAKKRQMTACWVSASIFCVLSLFYYL